MNAPQASQKDKSPFNNESLLETPEVRSYVKHMVIALLVGIALMAGTATWAWNTIGSRLHRAAPLPSGAPPISSVPATTR